MVSVASFGGYCARTDAVILKSYLPWVPIFSYVRSIYVTSIHFLSQIKSRSPNGSKLCSRSGQKSSPVNRSLLNLNPHNSLN